MIIREQEVNTQDQVDKEQEGSIRDPLDKELEYTLDLVAQEPNTLEVLVSEFNVQDPVVKDQEVHTLEPEDQFCQEPVAVQVV